MKILSKKGQKDYYDFLVGIYGEDPLIVYDRTKTVSFNDYVYCDMISPFNIYVGGFVINGIKQCINKTKEINYYYGDKLLSFSNQNHVPFYWPSIPSHLVNKKIMRDFVSVSFDEGLRRRRTEFLSLTPYADVNGINEKFKSPVVFEIYGEFFPNCLLKDIKLNKFLTAEQAFKLISDWISGQKTKSENHLDSRTDIQKIESYGFDKKNSFRNIK